MAQNPANVFVDPDTASVNVAFGTNGTLREETLSQGTVGQSFAIDYKGKLTNPVIYVIQCKNKTTDTGAEKGDLVITKLDAAGNQLGTMHLVHDHYTAVYQASADPLRYYEGVSKDDRSWGFGHGSQIAIEYAPDGIYLWCDNVSEVLDKTKTPKDNLYDVAGDDLARFKYQDGTFHAWEVDPYGWTMKHEVLASVPGVDADKCTNFSISFDNHYKRAAVRYKDNLLGGIYRVSVFSYTYNADNIPVLSHLSTFNAPAVPWYSVKNGVPSAEKVNLPAQGFTLFGNFIYFNFGSAYNHDEHYSPETYTEGQLYPDDKTPITNVGNHHVVQYNWSTKAQVDYNISEAGRTLSYREPEGMQMIPTTDSAGNVTKLQLCFGYASGTSGARKWSLYAKERTGIPTT